MSEIRKQSGRENDPPEPKADQPHPPGGGETCKDIEIIPPPDLKSPEPCPPSNCHCPPGPSSNTNCIEDLIAKQAAEIAAAEKAKAFKADLEALLGKAKTASQDYTQENYEKLRKRWVDQDSDIEKLIHNLVCAVPCWRCVIECHICPLINDLYADQQWLYGDGTLYTDVHNLYDLQYWHTRDKEKKERSFNRIKSVLAVWEKPAQTIDKILTDNAKLISDTGKLLGSEPGKVVYDVFLRLVPMHLAIAPPSGSAWTTNILKEYTDFCPCDKATPDDCCGPDVGEWSLRQRLIGPQPYLVDPNDYFKLVCCLVEKRYEPAKNALGKAEADLATVDDKIKSLKAQIENGLKSFDKDAKGAIPSVINCGDYESNETDSKFKQSR